MYQYYIHKADAHIVKEIFDNKVDNAKLIEIKIPVHFPTMQDWTEYEVIEGQIQLKDAYYNYVRLKMTRDTMYFVCLPNTVKTRLEKANVIMAKEITDVPLSKKGHDAALKKLTVPGNYSMQAFEYHYDDFGSIVKTVGRRLSSNFDAPYLDSPGKPPNLIS